MYKASSVRPIVISTSIGYTSKVNRFKLIRTFMYHYI